MPLHVTQTYTTHDVSDPHTNKRTPQPPSLPCLCQGVPEVHSTRIFLKNLPQCPAWLLPSLPPSLRQTSRATLNTIRPARREGKRVHSSVSSKGSVPQPFRWVPGYEKHVHSAVPAGLPRCARACQGHKTMARVPPGPQTGSGVSPWVRGFTTTEKEIN